MADEANEPSKASGKNVVRRRLDTLPRIRREAARVYWDLRQGRIKAFTAVACMKALKEIREAVQFEVTEERLVRLEALAGLDKQGRQVRRPQTFEHNTPVPFTGQPS